MAKHRSLPLLAKNRRSYQSFQQEAIKSASTVALFSFLFVFYKNSFFYFTDHLRGQHFRDIGTQSTATSQPGLLQVLVFLLKKVFFFITSTAITPPPPPRGQP
jgi:hypothetical protein